MLRSNRIVTVALPKERMDKGDSSELGPEQQEKLLLLSTRTLALPIGRGMYTLASTRFVLASFGL
jgi:hypothetical protein